MKRNRIFKALLALALAMVLCLSAVPAALADGEPVYGTEDAPAQASIAKTLQMPEGTITPSVDFSFIITPVSVDGSTSSDDTVIMPELGDQVITFTDTDTGSTANYLKTVTLETGNFLANIVWPHAGVYVYTITELADTYQLADGETMLYSPAEYELVVYVANGDNGVYISAISAIVTVPDNDSQTVNDKVDPTPGSSNLVFTNTYRKTNGGAAPTSGVLFVGKTVAGDLGDRDLYFEFELTITDAATFETGQTYTVYVLDEGNRVVTSILNTRNSDVLVQGENYTYIAVTGGVPITIYLKHGQRLSFVDAVVGTRYVVTEEADSRYDTTIELTANSVGPVTLTDYTTGEQLISEGLDQADYINERSGVSPTGIPLDMLPYVIMIILAAGAIAVFVIAKLRKKVI